MQYCSRLYTFNIIITSLARLMVYKYLNYFLDRFSFQNSKVFNASNKLIQFGGFVGAEQAGFHVTYAGGGGELDSFCHILLNIAQ